MDTTDSKNTQGGSRNKSKTQDSTGTNEHQGTTGTSETTGLLSGHSTTGVTGTGTSGTLGIGGLTGTYGTYGSYGTGANTTTSGKKDKDTKDKDNQDTDDKKDKFESKTKKNYYQLLGLHKQATQDDIDKAYKKMSAEWHPDKHRSSNKKQAQQKFSQITQAYEILSNKKKRKHYDQLNTKEYTDQDADKTFENFYSNKGTVDENESKFFDTHFPERKKNYYEILGVSRTATDDQIEKSYRKLALQYHPKSNQDNAEYRKKFNELNQAYTVLSDKSGRKNYDDYNFSKFDPNKAHQIFDSFWKTKGHDDDDTDESIKEKRKNKNKKRDTGNLNRDRDDDHDDDYNYNQSRLRTTQAGGRNYQTTGDRNDNYQSTRENYNRSRRDTDDYNRNRRDTDDYTRKNRQSDQYNRDRDDTDRYHDNTYGDNQGYQSKKGRGNIQVYGSDRYSGSNKYQDNSNKIQRHGYTGYDTSKADRYLENQGVSGKNKKKDTDRHDRGYTGYTGYHHDEHDQDQDHDDDDVDTHDRYYSNRYTGGNYNTGTQGKNKNKSQGISGKNQGNKDSNRYTSGGAYGMSGMGGIGGHDDRYESGYGDDYGGDVNRRHQWGWGDNNRTRGFTNYDDDRRQGGNKTMGYDDNYRQGDNRKTGSNIRRNKGRNTRNDQHHDQDYHTRNMMSDDVQDYGRTNRRDQKHSDKDYDRLASRVNDTIPDRNNNRYANYNDMNPDYYRNDDDNVWGGQDRQDRQNRQGRNQDDDWNNGQRQNRQGKQRRNEDNRYVSAY